MSLLARRRRDQELERARALVAMRDAVVAATTAYMPGAGSAATLEAVDEALAQLVAGRAHHADADEVKALWIRYARCRLIDEYRSADSRYRDATAVDDHAQALAVVGVGDLCDVIEAERQSWRVREIISVLHGEQREWAEAWCREVLSGSLPAGAQPRGLPDARGWTSAKAEKTSQRARRKMASFVTRRQRGDLCTKQRALLDEFRAASRGGRLSEELDQERFEAIVFHAVGCEDCFTMWHVWRRAPRLRPLAIVMLPIDAIVAAAQSFAAKLAGAAAVAATSVLGRLGIGGAAAGGGAATIGAKTAAVCVGVVCAATAGGEIAAVVPPLLRDRAPQTREQDAPPNRAQAVADPRPATAEPTANPLAPAPQPPPVAPTTPASAEAAVESTPAPAVVIPGDLPAATSGSSPTPVTATSSASRHTTPPSPLASPPPSAVSSRTAAPVSSGGGSSCVPGSLGC